jgi:hypothetical protein
VVDFWRLCSSGGGCWSIMVVVGVKVNYQQCLVAMFLGGGCWL